MYIATEGSPPVEGDLVPSQSWTRKNLFLSLASLLAGRVSSPQRVDWNHYSSLNVIFLRIKKSHVRIGSERLGTSYICSRFSSRVILLGSLFYPSS